MKTLSAALKSHIAQEVTTLCTIWKITRTDGVILYFTDLDVDLVFAGNTYKAATGYSSTAVSTSSGLAVDNVEIHSMVSSSDITEADILAGKYDHALVEIGLINYESPDDGRMIMRYGRLGEISMKDDFFVAELRGLMSFFENSIGEVYSPGCRANLGDGRCQVNWTPNHVDEPVTSVTSRRQFGMDGVFIYPPGGFVYGPGSKVVWKSGLNSGLTMEVRKFTDGATATVDLVLPMPNNIQVGDLFDLYFTCDKTFATCKNVWNNVANFRGEPHVPGVERSMMVGRKV